MIPIHLKFTPTIFADQLQVAGEGTQNPAQAILFAHVIKGDPPVLTGSKSGRVTTISSDGTPIAEINDGEDGQDGTPGPNVVSTTTDSDITGLLKGASGKVAQAVAGTDYQAPLVSGQNVKTINNQSILGEGNIEIQGGGGSSDFDQLTNRPKYNGSAMTHGTNIPAVPTKTSDLMNDSGFLTQHQSLADYRKASDQDAIDAGITGRIGTIEGKESGWDAKYSKPSGGIPKTDLTDAVQSSLGKADSALQEHQSLAAYRTAAEQDAIHDATKQNVISDLSTIRSGAAAGATALQTVPNTYRTGADQDVIDAAKADKTPIATPAAASSYEIAVDTMTNLGTLTGAIALTLATEPSDGKVHIYAFTFVTGASAPTITWPSGISWQGGSAPTINANKAYEVSICQNKTLISEY